MSIQYTNAQGQLVPCTGPAEPLKVLNDLKNIMRRDDMEARDLYDWLAEEIRRWNRERDNGASQERLDVMEEVNMSNIIQEINANYLHPEWYQ